MTTAMAKSLMKLTWPEAARRLYGRNWLGNMALGGQGGFDAVLAYFGKSLEDYKTTVRAVCEWKRQDYCGVCGEGSEREDHFGPSLHVCLGPRPRRNWIRNKWIVFTPPHWMTAREKE